jgi:hypothetical protein
VTEEPLPVFTYVSDKYWDDKTLIFDLSSHFAPWPSRPGVSKDHALGCGNRGLGNSVREEKQTIYMEL